MLWRRYNHAYIRAICSYLGGKGREIDGLIALFLLIKVDVFIDSCGGSGIVTVSKFAKRRIINDISTEMTTIYKALANYGKLLTESMSALKIDDNTFYKVKHFLEERKEYSLADYEKDTDELILAAAYSWYVRAFSRSGSKVDKTPKFTTAKIRRWRKLLREDITILIRRFSGVEVWNLDVCDLLKKIKKEIHEETLVYIDPPYLSDKNSGIVTNPETYKGNSSKGIQSFDEFDHHRMIANANFLPKDQFHVIISGYENELYDRLFNTGNYEAWSKKYITELAIQCASGDVCKVKKRAREFVYMNFDIVG